MRGGVACSPTGGSMGLFWDLMQQSQISNQQQHSASLDERVTQLEQELRATRELLHTLITRLETHLRSDLNADGRIG